ncbi:hypothetical protein TG4357_00761 [Thalassovita gelatinovora]|uniref:Uncharacterized protein n=1 Tax=Thalassovita gelatinovora TaxID=53501 RepID=A0A0P1F6G8_THAGE|nr:hypothetical protein TG4357_00761 [Thalassovita gelatinovora]
MPRTKVPQIYKKMDRTVRYLGVDRKDGLATV